MFLAVIYIVLGIITALFLYFQWCHTYWKRKGVPYEEPHFIYGNVYDMMKDKLSPGMYVTRKYEKFKARGCKHVGLYTFNVPTWLPIDMDLIKNILTRDFSYFMNHNAAFLESQHAPMQKNLFSLTGDKWRNLRVKLTPTFTSGKLKMMFQTLLATTEGLEEILDEHARVQDAIDIKDLVARFATDVIGSCAFGLDCNTLKNPDSDFRKYGDKLFQRPEGWKRIVVDILRLMPQIVRVKLRIKPTDQDSEDFFRNIVEKTVGYREKNNIFRKDFMHLLIQLKNRGAVTEDESLINKGGEKIKSEDSLSMDEILAQTAIFFLAGFETSATTMSFALLEMSLNQEIQDKLRKEINDVLKRHDDKISYEAVMEMKYLDMIVHETLRKHPPLPFTPRTCSKDYIIPGENLTIKKGMQVQIPIFAIHHDPDYYPDPETFDPERFTEENKAKRPPYSFLAFGEGPRLCIGARFGLMQTKVGLIAIVKNFRVTLSSKTKTPITYDPKKFFSTVEGKLWLNVARF